MKKQFLALTGAIAAAASLSYAIPFDSSTGLPATATVGPDPGNDYNSLSAAAAAFSSVSGGINREWTLEITGDLTETAASYFGNVFAPGAKLTIKPQAGKQPTVTFTIPSAPAGIYGDIVFGVTDGNLVTSSNDRPSDGNYVIDGSNTVGGTTRDLTFQVPNTHNDPMLRVVRIWGDTKNMVIKNLRVINYDNSGTGHCIGLAAGHTDVGTPRKPEGIVIENCYLEANPAGASATGVESSITANNTLYLGYGMQNIVVRNCTIVAKQRGVFYDGVASGVIENNDITINNGTGTGSLYTGIYEYRNNNLYGGTINARNNVIKMTKVPATTAGSYGGIGIFLDGGMGGTTLNVYNNIVKDWVFTSTSAVDMLYRAVSIGTTDTVVLVEHNSLDCPANNTAVSGATAGRVAGISVPLTQQPGGSVTLRNNIIRMGNTGPTAACIYLGATTSIVSEGNDLVPNGTPQVGRVGSSNYTTLADWQGAGFDSTASGGQSVDPASVVPAWDANLHFALKPVGLGTVASSTVLTDIDGDPRPATGAYPGADEPPGPAAGVADWALF